jgi:hypothetical protein
VIETDIEVARRLTMGLFRARGCLLALALASSQVPHSEQAVAEAAALGLSAEDVRAIGPQKTYDDFAWAAAERRPAEMALLLPPDAIPGQFVVETAARLAREMSGLPLPDLAIDMDPMLGSGAVRLRARAIRTPPVPIAMQGDTAAFDLARLMLTCAAMLLDPVTMLRLLLRAAPGTIDLLPDVLRIATAPLLAQALRPLLDGGFGLPDATSLVTVVNARMVVARLPERRVTLPDTIAVGKEDARHDALAARLRAAVVPGALLRLAGGVGRTASLWSLPEEELRKLPLDSDPGASGARLAPLSLPAARAGGVLLVPDGFARRVFDVLCDALPTLCVAEVGEWPRQLDQRPRDTIRL